MNETGITPALARRILSGGSQRWLRILVAEALDQEIERRDISLDNAEREQAIDTAVGEFRAQARKNRRTGDWNGGER